MIKFSVEFKGECEEELYEVFQEWLAAYGRDSLLDYVDRSSALSIEEENVDGDCWSLEASY